MLSTVVGGPVWVQDVVLAASLLAAVLYIWRKAIKPVVVGVNRISDQVDRLKVLADNAPVLTEVPGRLTALEQAVAELKRPVLAIDERTKTLEPNGGSSMHDVVARIDTNTIDTNKGLHS